jgi:putative membrane-bound dehydrogenase-like protein
MMHWREASLVLFIALGTNVWADDKPKPDRTTALESRETGALPVGRDGEPLNLDFETGNLGHWLAEGAAFEGQPVKGDTVSARRGDMKSQHAGRFWIGTYERGGDGPKGTLTSAPFRVTHPYASFLVAGGSHPETHVELVRMDNRKIIFQASGDDTENLKAVLVDLRDQMGKEIFIRLVDEHSGGWGHINFDDFRFHKVPPKLTGESGESQEPVDRYSGLAPAAAAATMTVPPGFTVTLFAGEPDIVQPIAMTIDDRGRLWVAEAYAYPIRVPDHKARDRILIFEDKDGDGRFDTRKVFSERLNLVSGLEVGFGGVWVGAAPYLLFIPDRNRDDVPDGKPQILLDGWGYQDTHETLNSFLWGPDGWLYGCHGVFTHSRVGKPGTPDRLRVPINAGIWRYHPTRHEFEVFAWGTSNPWGVDFDDYGECFSTACVIPHLFHIIPGGRYHRQAGEHYQPHTYADIKTIADHLHYTGNIADHAWWGHTPDVKRGVAAAGGGHAHAGAMIYLGDRWPDAYRGKLFMNNIHGARVNVDRLEPKGSGFIGRHDTDFLVANDRWSQLLYFRYGPDGQVYMIDWYDKNQCHRTDLNVHDRSNGRIFKISYVKQTRPHSLRTAAMPLDLQKLSSDKLVELQLHKNDWYVRHARRILQERGEDAKLHGRLAELVFQNSDPTRQLRGLWALAVTGGLTEDRIAQGLASATPYVRAWTVRLATESSKPSKTTLTTIETLAANDPSPVVRKFIASALQRLPLEQRWDILEKLLAHPEDAQDHNLPLLYWYAIEPLADRDPGRALRTAQHSRVPLHLGFMVRRIASSGTRDAIELLTRSLAVADSTTIQRTYLAGLREGLRGRRRVLMPTGWPETYRTLLGASDAQVRSEAAALSVTFGLAEAYADLRRIVADRKAATQERHAALAALLAADDKSLVPTLQQAIDDPALRGAALRGLAGFDDPQTPSKVLAHYGSFSPAEKRDALATLSGRASFARALLEAVAKKKIPTTDVTADTLRQLRNLGDRYVDKLVAEIWGVVRETPADKANLIARHKALITRRGAKEPDPMLGRAVFAKVCAQCHSLFGTGGNVGPDITGANRSDFDYLLSNILDPSAVMAKEYMPNVIATTDGRIITGIVKSRDQQALTVATANEVLTLPAGEVEEMKPTEKSMMPDDLLQPLGEHEIRSLLAYLSGPGQAPMLATADNINDFFNGRDLTGWEGSAKLWRLENGEIVGSSPGLDHNEFLRSPFAVGDFRLFVKVKLVGNIGNSGIQFRSQTQPDGHVKGYQADIGAGWWGKLYEELGRGLLWNHSGEKYVRVDDWNDYEIVAVGSRIRTYLNGRLCVDLDDPAGARRGIIAWQLHSGGPMEVRFKDVRLELAPAIEPVRNAAAQ